MKRILLLGALALAATGACVSSGTPPDPCSNGICNAGGSGSSGSSGSGAGCTEAWSCSPWVKEANGMYTRKCTDANMCGTTGLRPPEGPVALPDLDFDYYKCKVEPILDAGCAMLGCHGKETERSLKIYARGRLRHKEIVPQVPTCPIGPQMVDLDVTGSGTIMCVGWSPHTATEWQQNYDNARSFMVGVTDPEQSDLLLQPVIGGNAHAGVHLFAKGDADYNTIKSWLSGTKLGMTCDPSPN